MGCDVKKYLRIEIEDAEEQWDMKMVQTNLNEVEYKSVLRKLMFKYPKEKVGKS